MANVLSRTPPYQFRRSVNDPYDVADWIFNPDMSPTVGFDAKYWSVSGDTVSVVDQAARDVIDAAELAAAITAAQAEANARVDATLEIEVRALLLNANKRINFLTTRVIELQDALLAAKASTGAVANLRDALPASYLATATRSLPNAIAAYKADVSAGEAD